MEWLQLSWSQLQSWVSLPSATSVAAFLALALSAATFYRNFFYTRHRLLLIPVQQGRSTAVRLALVNLGNRDAMLVDAHLVYWSFSENGPWHWVPLTDPVHVVGGAVVLKPQELKLIELPLPTFLPDPVRNWFVWFHGEMVDWVIFGLSTQAMNASGQVYSRVFQIGYAWPKSKTLAEMASFALTSFGSRQMLFHSSDEPLHGDLAKLTTKPFRPPMSQPTATRRS
jgi:hypothetical protein